jgi:hypothetical protein
VGKGKIGKAERKNVTGAWQWEEHQNKGVSGPVRGRGGCGTGSEEGGKGGGIFLLDGTCGRGAGGFCDTSARWCIRWHMGKVIAIRCSVEYYGSCGVR